jgi:lipopolysaccharide/colanic/teichoic acid biosynthesis glycosyltransferase
MACIFVWVKLVSRGPAIFRQVRIGKDGRQFTLYKFRSMYVNADTRRHSLHFNRLVKTNSPMLKLDLLSDSRLIPGGALLRAAGLDELPQLLNVLRGEMSVVGPRPCLPEEMEYFTQAQCVRFDALPGLTGVWQTEGKGISTFTEMNAMDASYVRKASLLMDLSIMWKTPCAIMDQLLMTLGNRSQRSATAPASKASKCDAETVQVAVRQLG